MDQCVYLRDALPGKTAPDGRPVHGCAIHRLCNTTGDAMPYAACPVCKDNLPTAAPDFAKRFQDQLIITGRDTVNHTDCLRGLLTGVPAAFLVCGGPSALSLPLNLLEQRGIWSLAVNNMAGFYRANAFVFSDPPSKFHHGIWLDPNVMKFCPIPKLARKRGRLRRKRVETFEDLVIDGTHYSTCDCPNVWGFARRSWMRPDDSFFLEDHAAWGNHNDGVKRTGEDKTVCTPLLGLRLLYYLGIRRVYLVGVDFYMDPTVGLHDNYAFKEERDAGAVASNNAQYRVVNGWLTQMSAMGVFAKFGLEIFNCNPASGLRAFAHVPFEDAVADALRNYPASPFDLQHWYLKK